MVACVSFRLSFLCLSLWRLLSAPSPKMFCGCLHDLFRLLNIHLNLISMRYSRNLATFNTYVLTEEKILCANSFILCDAFSIQ